MEVALNILKGDLEKVLNKLDGYEWISLVFLILNEDELVSSGFRYCQYVLHNRKKEIVMSLQRILTSRGSGSSLPQNVYRPVLQALYLIGRYDILTDSLGLCLEHSLHQSMETVDAIPPDRTALYTCFQGITQEQTDHILANKLCAWNPSGKNVPLEVTFCRNLTPRNYFELLCGLHDAFESEGLLHVSTLLKPHIKKISSPNGAIGNSSSFDFDQYYPLPQREPHGLCVIINVKKFLPPQSPDDTIPLDVRIGSEIDQQRLQGTFKLFGFNIIHLEDPGLEELCNCFANIRTDERLFSIACLAVCIMTHGHDDELYLYDRTSIPITDIRKLCYGQALIGKPRLYFVQACRGDQNLRPVFLRDSATTSNSESDCLISTATVKGYSAMRSQSSGSWYITDLCTSLQDHGHNMPLKTVLMKTRDKLQKRVDKYAGGYITQISEDKSTLIKDVQLVRSSGELFYEGLADLVMLEVAEEMMDWLVDECLKDLGVAP